MPAKTEATRGSAPTGAGVPPAAEDVLAGLRAMLEAVRGPSADTKQDPSERAGSGSAAAATSSAEMAAIRGQVVALTQQIEQIAAVRAVAPAAPGVMVPSQSRVDPGRPPRGVAAGSPPATSSPSSLLPPSPLLPLPFSPVAPPPSPVGVAGGAPGESEGQNIEIAELLSLLRGAVAPPVPAGRFPCAGAGAVPAGGGGGEQVGGILRALRAGAAAAQPGQAGEAGGHHLPEADMTKARRLGLIT